MLGKYQKEKKNHKSKKQNKTKNLKKKVNYVGLFTAALTRMERDTKQLLCTASSLLHLFLDCLKHLNTNKMCSKNNESKQQVTLQIMECEPFLPLSEEIGSQLCLETTLELWSRVCTQRHSICVQPQDVCLCHSLAGAPSLTVPTKTTLMTGAHYPATPRLHTPICRQFSLLRHGSSFNTGPSEATMYQKYYAKHV